MPVFLTLRDAEGNALATAMLPPRQQAAGRDGPAVCPLGVRPGHGDPYPEHGDAIPALGEHFGLALDRARCYPYRRI